MISKKIYNFVSWFELYMHIGILNDTRVKCVRRCNNIYGKGWISNPISGGDEDLSRGLQSGAFDIITTKPEFWTLLPLRRDNEKDVQVEGESPVTLTLLKTRKPFPFKKWWRPKLGMFSCQNGSVYLKPYPRDWKKGMKKAPGGSSLSNSDEKSRHSLLLKKLWCFKSEVFRYDGKVQFPSTTQDRVGKKVSSL